MFLFFTTLLVVRYIFNLLTWIQPLNHYFKRNDYYEWLAKLFYHTVFCMTFDLWTLLTYETIVWCYCIYVLWTIRLHGWTNTCYMKKIKVYVCLYIYIYILDTIPKVYKLQIWDIFQNTYTWSSIHIRNLTLQNAFFVWKNLTVTAIAIFSVTYKTHLSVS